jgi:signal transduction histidine kinase
LNDLSQNNEKIVLHGKRADNIVKGMLEHSKQSTGAKDLTDINKLVEEYLRLAYNGFVAKNKMFNIELLTRLEITHGLKLFVAGQDIGTVLINVFNNAFYAVYQRSKSSGPDYVPKVEIRTFNQHKKIVVEVKDNGTGIPENIKDKIIQPFFTTKPPGEGTGLGLSLSYDIVVNGHNGTITWDSSLNEGSIFLITLPLSA